MVVGQFFQVRLHAGLALHRLRELRTCQLLPGGRDNGCAVVSLAEQFDGLIQLLLRNSVGPGHDNGRGGFHLVIIELTEVLGVYLYFSGIHHRNGITQSDLFIGNLIDSADHIGQLAHTGGLNDDPFRGVLGDHLIQRLSEITHQTAANTAGVHFRDINAGILQKAAVNADLSKFVFNQHQLLTAVMLLDHLFDQGCFARSEKTGVNIDFCHGYSPSVEIFKEYYTTIFPT